MIEQNDILHLSRWAAQECYWQGSGELSVHRMITAWNYAYNNKGKAIAPIHIQIIGEFVEPKLNRRGFRTQPISIGFEIRDNQDMIADQIERLCSHGQYDLNATEWFIEFEIIHPFLDGNGRTGTILYNWLNETLEPGEVVWPPNVFKDKRRDMV